jgi:hypothetical protein
MTSPEVSVEELRFYVTGAPSSDSEQPTVTMVLRASAKAAGGIKTDFDLQTTMTQRVLDL